jgi:hypothetical protein
MAGTLTVTGLVAGFLTGEKVIGPVTLTGSATIGQIDDLALSSGDNAISVPAGSSAVLFVLPASNTQVLKLRTNLNSGDAGMPFGPLGWSVLPLAAGVTQLTVNVSGSTTCEASFI